MFVNELKNEMNKKLQETENGALGFSTSGKILQTSILECQATAICQKKQYLPTS